MFTLLWKPTVRKNSRRLRSFNQVILFWTFGGAMRSEEPSMRRVVYSMAREKNLWIASVRCATLYSIVSRSESGRSVERPDGSPINPVAPPIWFLLLASTWNVIKRDTHQRNDVVAAYLEVKKAEERHEMPYVQRPCCGVHS